MHEQWGPGRGRKERKEGGRKGKEGGREERERREEGEVKYMSLDELEN